jgi:aryl-alcohol dehydrogenase-like predicted oxidoreductase
LDESGGEYNLVNFNSRSITMNYRRLGNSGLKVSELSFGSWVSFHNQLGEATAAECMKAAYEEGVNFFDNAEVYALGKSEEIMGAVLKKMDWRRSSYVISTKFFWGLHEGQTRKTPSTASG